MATTIDPGGGGATELSSSQNWRSQRLVEAARQPNDPAQGG
jgi:hypothetical protein